jgi:hypothetical protein
MVEVPSFVGVKNLLWREQFLLCSDGVYQSIRGNISARIVSIKDIKPGWVGGKIHKGAVLTVHSDGGVGR